MSRACCVSRDGGGWKPRLIVMPSPDPRCRGTAGRRSRTVSPPAGGQAAHAIRINARSSHRNDCAVAVRAEIATTLPRSEITTAPNARKSEWAVSSRASPAAATSRTNRSCGHVSRNPGGPQCGRSRDSIRKARPAPAAAPRTMSSKATGTNASQASSGFPPMSRGQLTALVQAWNVNPPAAPSTPPMRHAQPTSDASSWASAGKPSIGYGA